MAQQSNRAARIPNLRGHPNSSAAAAPQPAADPAAGIHSENARPAPQLPRKANKPAPIAAPDSEALFTKEWPIGTLAFCAAVTVGLFIAWQQSRGGHLTPVEGLGYYLGIAGSLMMLSLFLYPLRKYWKRMSQVGTVHGWFTAHMAIGILGPALVVAHSGFSFRSSNGTMALMSTLVVVASGIIGRYLYSRVLISASGKRAKLSELLQDIGSMHSALIRDVRQASEIELQLKAFEAEATSYRTSRFGGCRAAIFLPRRARAVRRQLTADATAILSARALREHWHPDLHGARADAVIDHLDAYIATIMQATSLHFFERMVRLWHLFHVPLFFLLILTVVAHVIFVHMY